MLKWTIAFLAIASITCNSLPSQLLPGYQAVDPKAVGLVIRGVIEGIGIDLNYPEIQTCIEGSDNVTVHITSAINLFKKGDVMDILWGIQEVGKALEQVPHVVIDCNATIVDIEEIVDNLKSWGTADKYLWHVLENLLTSGPKIMEEINATISAVSAENWEEAGVQIGTILAKIFLEGRMTTSKAYAKILNSIPKLWVATSYPRFENMTLAQFKREFLGAKKDTMSLPVANVTVNDPLPDNFDARSKWPNCVHPIRDQGQCGSCWSFGVTESLTDRFCIFSNQSINQIMSPQYLVSCDTTDYGCNGGLINVAWKFIERSGTVTESCWPYESGSGAQPKCSTFKACKDGKPIKNYYAVSGSSKVYSNPTAIKNELITNGPMSTRFDVYQDFMSYKSGIYHHVSGGRLGGHAIKVIGWGVEAGVKYWICANSWNTGWGENGFFRIREGDCGIDSSAAAGIPDLNRI